MKVFFLNKKKKKKIDFIFILLCSLIGLSPKWEKKRLESFKNLSELWVNPFTLNLRYEFGGIFTFNFEVTKEKSRQHAFLNVIFSD